MFTNPQKSLLLVVCISLFFAIALTVSLWDINYWPTDTEVYFFDAAHQIPQIKYISQIHESMDKERVRWLHGKEMFILSAYWFERILNDFTTLRPFIILGVASVCFSSILVYLIARGFWGGVVGWICYFIFTTSFWPYLYILFTKHQPLGLFFFLLAVYLLLSATLGKWGKKQVSS
jgi:hypothetical protein